MSVFVHLVPSIVRSAIATTSLAVIGSFWGRAQTELLSGTRSNKRIELANAMFEYLEIFHNRQRRHSVLRLLTQIEFGNVRFTPQPVA
ncbi:IS3 family transposase [Rhodococcus erythropolis]